MGFFIDPNAIPSWLLESVDISLVLLLTYVVLLAIGERRTLWMVRGLIVLMLAAVVSERLKLQYLSFVLERLVLGSAVAMAVVFQSEFRQFLERLGRGELLRVFQTSRRFIPEQESTIDRIVDAIKELSQNRTGALIMMETGEPIDERFFSVSGVPLDAEVSKEILQTIFQTTTLLHDGAVQIRGSRIVAASIILPLSERVASRQLGTRHRAAMGITERVDNCLCLVVSEETGSISLAEGRSLNRPLTSTKLKELLEQKFSTSVERDATPNIRRLSRRLGSEGRAFFQRLFGSW
ncbi:diadenylate cyclase CdaA [Spirulina sp. 06S082]|uniref:diadenylate cyclase CdaA n=1 Tax=Spirulina sp. 06S082 TaxID=3110248 RepID=UPI002B1FECA9|nr:diadenylate cyclase CdaA [Spirulina sp. 06S082]MEA5469832.1 diadenylate cyclase CdaA [Spirulina sp. 06S082]